MSTTTTTSAATTVTKTSNFIPDLVPFLLETDEIRTRHPEKTTWEIKCKLCRRMRLTISGSPAPGASAQVGESREEKRASRRRKRKGRKFERLVPLNEPTNLYAQGFERTLVFPCGHIFGDRCVRDKLFDLDTQRHLTCPSCGFEMTYKRCGHAIAPALIPAHDAQPVCDVFPLTIPEGGQIPSHCKECRWNIIRKKINYTLSSRCVICAQKQEAGVFEDPAKHEEHRMQHVMHGIKDKFVDIMALVQPDFETRNTLTAAQRAKAEVDSRDINAALLNAMALTELEPTVWRRTESKRLSEEQERRHMIGVQVIEDRVLSLLMGTCEEANCRRMW